MNMPNGDLNLVSLSISIGVFALLMGAILFFVRKILSRRELRVHLRNVCARAQKQQERFDLVDKHALDYTGALSASATQALYEIRRTLADVYQKVEDISSLLNHGEYSALDEARTMLKDHFPAKQLDRHLSRGSKRDWEERIDSLLQIVGEEIYAASAKAKDRYYYQMRKTGPQKRPTSLDLAEAGILKPIERKEREEE